MTQFGMNNPALTQARNDYTAGLGQIGVHADDIGHFPPDISWFGAHGADGTNIAQVLGALSDRIQGAVAAYHQHMAGATDQVQQEQNQLDRDRQDDLARLRQQYIDPMLAHADQQAQQDQRTARTIENGGPGG